MKSEFFRISHLLMSLHIGILVGCGDGQNDTELEDSTSDAADNAIASYTFESRFTEGASSVSYTGQTARHVLINEVKAQIGAVDPLTNTYVPGDVFAVLDGIYQHDWTIVPELPFTSLSGNDLQTNLDEISTNKRLVDKIAGNDSPGWTQDWAGWATALPGYEGEPSVPTSPDGFIQAVFRKLDALAVMHSEGNPPLDLDGAPISKVYVDADGVDWQQIAQKFLLGAVAFSQGTNDYLYKVAGVPGQDGLIDDSTAVQNNSPDQEGKPYTSMEHYWDEAFGYFGAAADYHLYSDGEVAGKSGRAEWQKFHDSNADGQIDLKSEFNFGHSQNASKRDHGSSLIEGGTAYDFSGEVFNSFRAGRALISSAEGDLSADELSELRGYIATIKSGWEKAIAATVIHYLNETLNDMAKLNTEDYDYYTHAKHWSELKGFGLGLQFNPDSPLHSVLDGYCEVPDLGIDTTITTLEACTAVASEEGGGLWIPQESAFTRFHRLLGDSPVLSNSDAERETYLGIRTLLGSVYGFDSITVAGW